MASKVNTATVHLEMDRGLLNHMDNEGRKDVSPEEKNAARRLKEAWDKERKKRDVEWKEWNKQISKNPDKKEKIPEPRPKLTQYWFADTYGWSQPTVNHYLSGKLPLNLNAIVKFCIELDIYVTDIYPEITETLKTVIPQDQVDKKQEIECFIDTKAIRKSKIPKCKVYSSEIIVSEGCFLDELELISILERLKSKKNIILQGPPGTGKTWLAKRLAFALIGQKNDEKLRAVQFHPNLSYEDFVRGWRPSGDGKLAMVDGPFMEMIVAASNDPDTKHVFVIEEINRGNPAQIFGEMLTLLEADKRNPDAALELCYRKSPTEKIFIPDNLYVIGTMNIADRSLALVDLALRRRFAFIDMEPKLGDRWRNWVSEKCEIDILLLSNIEQRIIELNVSLSLDPSLGRQFQIGHSFVTPPNNYKVKDANEWFKQVVQTEIAPLLEEYWFDAPDKARHARERLLAGL